jgi:hypothetical protein
MIYARQTKEIVEGREIKRGKTEIANGENKGR